MTFSDHDLTQTMAVYAPVRDGCDLGLRLSSQPRPPATLITISGEIGAYNAERVNDYVLRFVHIDHPLVLDLSRVEFLGTAGLRAILRFAAERRTLGQDRALVVSDAGKFLLRMAVHHSLAAGKPLVAVRSVDEALQRLAALPNAGTRLQSLTSHEGKRC